MKLTEIAIDGPLNGLNNFRNLHLGRFDDGLNFVYGENSAGKSTLRKYVRGVLLGFEASTQTGLENDYVRGHLQVRTDDTEIRLDRDFRNNDTLKLTSLSGHPLGGSSFTDASLSQNGSLGSANSLSHLVGKISAELYDAVFSFSFRNSRDNAHRMSSVLRTQLGVPPGPAAIGDDSEYQIWKRESTARSAKLLSLQARVEELNRQRSTYLREIETAESARRARLAELDRQLEAISLQIKGLDIETARNQLTIIEREIAELRIIIEAASRRVSYTPTVTPSVSSVEPFAALYQRLDEIDNQIRRWRRVQTDIQSQRVRLKDEMVVWNELTLESDEHPYHNAREILGALENRVDQAENHAKRWSQARNAQASDPSQLVHTIQELCKNMRDDLYGLCQELAQQYKHIRHKSAAAELKQLRRCYNEMGENTDRLVRRRESMINEIRTIDPAGADAIVRSETGFCQCAMHEGYLAARRRFVAGNSVGPAIDVSPRIVTADVSKEIRRLDLLESQRQEKINWLATVDVELATLRTQHARLVQERESVQPQLDGKNLATELARIETELRLLNDQVLTLARLIELDRHYVAPAPDAILLRAANLLNRVTTGDLLQVWLGESFADNRHLNEIQIRDRLGKVLNFSALDATLQDQVYLCLAFAAKEDLEKRGTSLPIIIDDAFANISRDHVTPTLELLNDLSRGGHQIILLTQHQYLADRVAGAPVFDLAPSTGYSTPYIQPERPETIPTPSAPPSSYSFSGQPSVYDFDSNSEYRVGEYGIQSNTGYPFSKYSTNGYPPIRDVTEFRDQADFTVRQPAIVHQDDYFRTEFAQTNAIERFNSQRAEVSYPIRGYEEHSQTRVSAVSVEDVGDQLGYIAAIDENSLLDRLELFDANQLRALTDMDVNTVGQLLDLDPDQLPVSLRDSGITSDQVSRWQSYVWLLSNIPGLRNSDARILVACGITEPEHLATSHGQQLHERIQRFLGSSEGHRFASSSRTISLDRINDWHRALNSTRSRWQHRDVSSRRSRPRVDRSQPISNGQSDREYAARDSRPRTSLASENGNRSSRTPNVREYQPREQTPDGNRAESNREPREVRSPRMQTPQPRTRSVPPIKPAATRFERDNERSARPNDDRRETDRESTRARESSNKVESRTSDPSEKQRFYLDLKDHIEAAPSIGPKTAERFEKIGVFSVEDFLKQTAESMAAKLKYKRITADVVRSWQHQARLVCRIPNLRGHDAQLLAACDFIDPESIGMMQPAALWGIIEPFAKSKDGQKIIRSGKQPDLAEVTDWINWAKQTRSLQAA